MLPIDDLPPLPKIDVPVYTVSIPSSSKEIKVRPFTVKEEKLLLLAAESDSPDDIINTVKQVINNCIIRGEFDVDRAPFFDVDYLFIFLRAKSIGESVEVWLTCNNKVEDHVCGARFASKLDISNTEIIFNEDISETIKLDKVSGVRMKYPSYAIIKKLDKVPEIEKKTKVIVNSIEHIFDKNGVYSSKDYSSRQLEDFVGNLTEENYKKLEAFVDGFPAFVVRINEDCPKCGFHHEVRYSDFMDFFY